jgi:hypothetical protein
MSDVSTQAHNATQGKKYGHLAHDLAGASTFWFVVLVLIVFMILVLFKPDYVMRKRDCERTDEVDCMTALLSAVAIAVLVCFLMWLVAYMFYC